MYYFTTFFSNNYLFNTTLRLGKLYQRALEYPYGLLQGTVVLPARGIKVATASEILCGKFIAREGALRTQ
jgi:hypothetical protein